MPTKSVCASCEFALASFHGPEPVPKTWVMSPVAAVFVFSSSILAVPTPPTSQPASVNGTQGAGVVFPVSVIMLGSGSFVASTGFVQYLNELVNFGTFEGGK